VYDDANEPNLERWEPVEPMEPEPAEQ